MAVSFFKRAQILVKAGCSSCANHTPESYPRIIHQKITIMNVSFGIVWDCIGLTSFNGPDKLIDQCWPDPMIRGDGRGVLVAEIELAERI